MVAELPVWWGSAGGGGDGVTHRRAGQASRVRFRTVRLAIHADDRAIVMRHLPFGVRNVSRDHAAVNRAVARRQYLNIHALHGWQVPHTDRWSVAPESHCD